MDLTIHRTRALYGGNTQQMHVRTEERKRKQGDRKSRRKQGRAGQRGNVTHFLETENYYYFLPLSISLFT